MLILVSKSDRDLRLDMDDHYSEPKGFVGRSICYRVDNGKFGHYGHIVGGSATLHLPGRERFFSTIPPLNQIVNNIFFHVEKPYPQRNFVKSIIQSWRKQISIDWKLKYGDDVLAFETLVELPRTGECYKRDGWTPVSITEGYTCKRIAGEGSDSWSGKRVWNTEDLRPKARADEKCMSLSIITGARKVRSFLVYDLEWVPGTLEVRLVGLYDGERYKSYRSVKDFILDNLTNSNRGKWFYAHAGGLADSQFVLHDLLTTLKDRGYQVKAVFSGSAAIIITITRGKNAWHLVDSYWLLRDKSAKIAKWLGTEKGGGGFEEETKDPDEEGISEDEYTKRVEARRNWYATTPFENLRRYNERDCTILWDAIHQLQMMLLQEGGQLGFTLASSGMNLFRRKHLTRAIDTSDSMNAIAHEAYTASRVENIQHHIDDGFYYDINSCFPHAMTFPCPGEYIGMTRSLPDDEYYIARVRVTVPDCFLPPLPLRYAKRLFFPTGTWESWYNGVDIQLLQREGGTVEKVYEVYRFNPFTDLRTYAEDFYAKKANAKSDFERAFYKLILNSLYGKFAESPIKQSMVFDPKTIDRTSMQMLMPGVWLKEDIVPVPHVHVPISAHITSIGRRTLYDFMSSCNEVHYCDTDGFSTTEILPTDDKELGNIKLEKTISKEKGGATYVAAKLYSMNGKIFKGKGFSRLSANRFAQILEGEAIDFERMTRIKELYKKGLTKPEEIKVTKTMRFKAMNHIDFDLGEHSLPKRAQYPDGTSRPWQVKELEDLVT